jgi:hypothetical protein
MNIQIPPVFFYFIGCLLIVFGALRAYQLGWKRRGQSLSDEIRAEEAASGGEPPASRMGARPEKRHMTFGVLWVAMGIFLVISTYLNARR